MNSFLRFSKLFSVLLSLDGIFLLKLHLLIGNRGLAHCFQQAVSVLRRDNVLIIQSFVSERPHTPIVLN